MTERELYWFNTKTGQVEKGLKSSSLDRIGPFETEAEAKNAWEIVRLRALKWKEEEEGERN
jgi:hypothetical protein